MTRALPIAFLTLMLICPALIMEADAADSAAPRRVEIVARRFGFEPSTVTLKRGVPVDLVLKSLDVAHGLRFRDLGIELKAQKGHDGEAKFTPQKEGDFTGHCSVFCGTGHIGMTLTLRVEP